jgi:hypothetical protein
MLAEVHAVLVAAVLEFVAQPRPFGVGSARRDETVLVAVDRQRFEQRGCGAVARDQVFCLFRSARPLRKASIIFQVARSSGSSVVACGADVARELSVTVEDGESAGRSGAVEVGCVMDNPFMFESVIGLRRLVTEARRRLSRFREGVTAAGGVSFLVVFRS